MELEYILIVEDDMITVSKIQNILSDHHYHKTLHARDYQDALHFISNDNIIFAFIDIDLGDERSGIDIAYRCLELGQFPYVFLSGFTDEDTINIAKLTRPYGFLSKPFEEKTLITTLEVTLHNYKHRKLDIDR